MIELKPCPFCGGEAKLEDLGGTEKCGRYFVKCTKCKIAQDTLWASKKTAIHQWNRRNYKEFAFLLSELFNDSCPCNYNDIDEWLPDLCEERVCPPKGTECWELMIRKWGERKQCQN